MTKVGSLFREYQFRTMPHVSTTYFHPKDSEPGGFFAKIKSTDAFCDDRLPGHWGKGKNSGVFPGFAAPRGALCAVYLARPLHRPIFSSAPHSRCEKGGRDLNIPPIGVSTGAWVDMELTVARKTAESFEISIRMGAAKYAYLHAWPSSDVGDRPAAIDAMGIWFPNSRSYAYVDLAPLNATSVAGLT
jgi:hypothetical protein